MRRTVAVSASCAIAVLYAMAPASAGRVAAAAKPARVRATTTIKAATLDPKLLVAAVRSAATPSAALFGAVLGAPVCPSGVATKPEIVVQCVVAFDTVLVPYLVRTAPDGTFTAAPTFPLHARVDVERGAAAIVGATVTCGKDRIVVAADASPLTCAVRKKPVVLLVSANGAVATAPPS